MFRWKLSGRGRPGGLGEFSVEVDELGVASPHLPGAHRGLNLYPVDCVWFGLGALFSASDVNGLYDGAHRVRRLCSLRE